MIRMGDFQLQVGGEEGGRGGLLFLGSAGMILTVLTLHSTPSPSRHALVCKGDGHRSVA